MKKTIAAVALSGALLLTGCSGTPTAQTGPAAAPTATASTPAPTPSATTSATVPAAVASAASPVANAVVQGLKDKIAAAAGDTSKYLPAVRASVKTGTDDELVDYGIEFCAAGTTNGVNTVVADMTSKGYSKDNAMTVAVSAGFFLCPVK